MKSREKKMNSSSSFENYTYKKDMDIHYAKLKKLKIKLRLQD